MQKIILLWILITISSTAVLTAEVWEAGAPSLMMDSYGAREMALGDTFVGIADDINTITVNPAGLNTLSSLEGSVMYMMYPLEMSFMHVAGGYPLPDSAFNGYAGASLTMFSVAEFEEYDLIGNKTGKKLSASDFLVNIGYGNNPLKFFGMKQNLNAGINLKLVSCKLVEDSSSAFGFDFGLLYKMDIISWGTKTLTDNLGIGFSIQNLGTSLNYGNEDTVLPRNMRIGAGYLGYKDNQHSVLAGFDINMPNDSDMITGIGIEYSFIEMIFGRIGYKITGRDVDHFSFGIGGKYSIAGKQASFDYAIIPLSNLGLINSFSLGIVFGAEKKEEKKAEIEEEKARAVEEKVEEEKIEVETETTETGTGEIETGTEEPEIEPEKAEIEEGRTEVEENKIDIQEDKTEGEEIKTN